MKPKQITLEAKTLLKIRDFLETQDRKFKYSLGLFERKGVFFIRRFL